MVMARGFKFDHALIKSFITFIAEFGTKAAPGGTKTALFVSAMAELV